ncbi:hypothetical protein CC80DRAFT_508659 [Byssothecium circinans]|uniref:Uncharacterized protein n=1 Tax=Byssothecium circinans TaxID=147558 RepID=A0A6A5TFZ1_9PLEO|nr:hypothetical protein CC80DRAFT_508659 [Byssothecium circinans]
MAIESPKPTTVATKNHALSGIIPVDPSTMWSSHKGGWITLRPIPRPTNRIVFQDQKPFRVDGEQAEQILVVETAVPVPGSEKASWTETWEPEKGRVGIAEVPEGRVGPTKAPCMKGLEAKNEVEMEGFSDGIGREQAWGQRYVGGQGHGRGANLHCAPGFLLWVTIAVILGVVIVRIAKEVGEQYREIDEEIEDGEFEEKV